MTGIALERLDARVQRVNSDALRGSDRCSFMASDSRHMKSTSTDNAVHTPASMKIASSMSSVVNDLRSFPAA